MGEPNEKQDNTSAEQEDTSKKDPETFSKEQVEEQVRKAKSDALADVGRLRTSSENAIKAARAAEERIGRMLKEQDEIEIEAAREEPDKLTQIRERQSRRETEAKLATVEQELNEKNERIKLLDEQEAASTKERNAREIAARLDVNANRLAKLAKFTDGSTEAIEEIAKELPKKESKTPLKPDSSKTIGGVSQSLETLLKVDIKGMTYKQILEHEQKLKGAFKA